MKYFSLSYILKKEDYKSYFRDFRKNNIAALLKRAILFFGIIVFIITIEYSFFGTEDESFKFPFYIVLMGGVMVYFPNYFARKISFSLLNARANKKEVRLDFYGDHIEMHVPQTENSKSFSQKHFKLKGFDFIAEGKDNFYFSYLKEKMLIIPKRAVDEENYGKIKNLINNYFSDKFITV